MTAAQRHTILKTILNVAFTSAVIGVVSSAVPLALMQLLVHYIPKMGVSCVGFFGAIWIWGALRKPGGIASSGFMSVAIPYGAGTTIAMLMLSERWWEFAGSVAGSALALGVAGSIAGYVTARRSVEQPEGSDPTTGAVDER